MNNTSQTFGGNPPLRPLTSEEAKQWLENASKIQQEQQETAEKAHFEQNKEQIRADAAKALKEWQDAVPFDDPNRSIVNHLATFYQVVMTEYPADINEEIGRMPSEICIEAMVHDLGVLSFAATLPMKCGDKEFQKWAQTSFALLGDAKKPIKQPLCNLIWLVSKKIDLAIRIMRKHAKVVQEELVKTYDERYHDSEFTDIIKRRSKDHNKRGEILEEKFGDLRKLLRARYGDGEDKFRAKHVNDFKLHDEIPKEEIEKIEEASRAAEVEDFRLASQFFRDQSSAT